MARTMTVDLGSELRHYVESLVDSGDYIRPDLRAFNFARTLSFPKLPVMALLSFVCYINQWILIDTYK